MLAALSYMAGPLFQGLLRAWLTMARGKYVRFLCFTQTVLHCMRAVNIRHAKSEWKTKHCSACAAVKWRKHSLAAISAILCAHWHSKRLLRSHIITKATKTPSGQTSNAILKLTQCVLVHWWLLLPCERKPTETRSNPVSLSWVWIGYVSMWKG